MDREAALEALIDAGIVSETGPDLELADEFLTAWNEAVSDLPESSAGLGEALAPHAGDADPETLVRLCVSRPDRIGGLVALSESLPDRPIQERLGLLLALEGLRRDPPRADGSPEAFLPVYPDQLPLFCRLAPKAVLYVWRADCPPCDVVVEELDGAFPSPDPELTLLSTYGPEDPALLQERFEVSGGPTVLLMVDGAVDLRLHGPQYRSVLDDEIRTLREMDV